MLRGFADRDGFAAAPLEQLRGTSISGGLRLRSADLATIAPSEGDRLDIHCERRDRSRF